MVVNDLYYGPVWRDTIAPIKAEASTVSISDEIIAAALRNIYRRDFNPHDDIEPNLFNAIAKTLGSAVTEGFSAGSGSAAAPSLGQDPFLHALRHSTDVFAAFKTHRAQNDMAARLLDSDGNLKPFKQWKEEVLPIASHQCSNWLQTEYNTAVLRARQAANWQQFQREKDILPNLKWLPSTSPNPGADHRPFWNTILPIDHPFWDQHRPGDRWNCKCDLTSTDEPATPVPSVAVSQQPKNTPQSGLMSNPGKTAEVFSDDHPYIAHAHKGAKEAVEKFIDENIDQPRYIFHEAASLHEAKEKLLGYGFKSVELADASLQQVNVILKAVHEEMLNGTVSIDRLVLKNGTLKSARVLNADQAASFFVDKATGRATMTFQTGVFDVNQYQKLMTWEQKIDACKSRIEYLQKDNENLESKLGRNKSADKMIKKMIKDNKSQITDWEIKMQKYQRSLKNGEKVLPQTIATTFEDVSRQVQCIMHHEFGHYVDHILGHPKISLASDVSIYGATARNEHFAECWAKYMMGSRELPKDMLKIFDGYTKSNQNSKFLTANEKRLIKQEVGKREKIAAESMVSKNVRSKLDGYNTDKWKHSYISKREDGFVATEKERLEEAKASKNERQKFNKEYRMCRVAADNGHEVEYLRGNNRAPGQTYDIRLDGIPTDLKSTDGYNNIVRDAKKAFKKQGAKAILYELGSHNSLVYNKLNEVKRKYNVRIFFYFKDEKIIREL